MRAHRLTSPMRCAAARGIAATRRVVIVVDFGRQGSVDIVARTVLLSWRHVLSTSAQRLDEPGHRQQSSHKSDAAAPQDARLSGHEIAHAAT
jgi:hypothetical protein